MSKNVLFVAVMKYADANGMTIAMSQAQRLVRRVLRSMDREEIRTVIGWAETTDDYTVITHSDPTGERAVRNVMALIPEFSG